METRVDWYFDFVSPYSYICFNRLRELPAQINYKPVLFAGLLEHWGQKGPAEIEPKRAWTFRQVHWLAHRAGIPIATPKRHPFNPLALSRLLWASAPDGATPSRWACETVLRHVWRSDGADAEDPARLAELRAAIAPRRDPSSDEVKERLRDATDEALARGVFGVPTIGVADKRLWGFDALDMVAALLRNDPWFAAPHWEREGAPRDGVQRS